MKLIQFINFKGNEDIKMKKTVVMIMLITLISKVLGFVRDLTLSFYYGTSNISDAYLISLTIPLTIFSLIGVGISTGYIPMYSKIERNIGEMEAKCFTNNLVNILLLICTIIIVVGLLFTEQIVKVFASGFEGETLFLATQFTTISLFGIYFTAIIYIFKGYLQLKGNYIVPALIGIPLNLIVIISIYLSSNINVIVLSIGSVIAIISQFIILIPFVYKKGYRHNLVFDLKDKHIKKMAFIVIPVIMGASVNQINILVDRTLASQIEVGGISALNYASRLIDFIQGIFVLSISTFIYPIISKMAVQNNIEGLKKSLLDSIGTIILLITPITIGAMVYAEPIIKMLFGRGAFDSQAIALTASSLFFYSIGIIGFGLREVLSNAFYSLQDTRTPMINATIGVFLNIILNIILSEYLGLGGLALATSISALLTTTLLILSLRKKIGPFGLRMICSLFFKVLISGLIMAILSNYCYGILINYINVNIALIFSIAVGVCIYAITLYFLKIKEIDPIVGGIKRKLKKIFLSK